MLQILKSLLIIKCEIRTSLADKFILRWVMPSIRNVDKEKRLISDKP